jgi:hypothetical protein
MTGSLPIPMRLEGHRFIIGIIMPFGGGGGPRFRRRGRRGLGHDCVIRIGSPSLMLDST